MSGRGRAEDAARKGGPMQGWSSRLLLIAAVGGVAGCATWRQWTHTGEAGAAPALPPAGTAPAHVMLAPGALKWQPFPLGGPGARLAVLSGDPEKSGPFVIRIRQPPGGKIAPHWHPADEHVTVVKRSEERRVGKECRSRW